MLGFRGQGLGSEGPKPWGGCFSVHAVLQSEAIQETAIGRIPELEIHM